MNTSLDENPCRSFFDSVVELSDRARADGIPEEILAETLLELSFQTSMQGGVPPFFAHILRVRREGEKWLSEFESRYGDRVDLQALAEGRVEPVKTDA